MRFSTTLNNQKCMEWEINATQGILVALLYEANAWANEEIIDNKTYYFVSRNLILKELPMFFEKADTVYRNLKVLAEKGIIEYIKHKGKNLIRLTEKGKSWNFIENNIEDNSEKNPTNKDTNIKKDISKNNKEKLEKIANTEAAQTGNFMSDLAGLLSKYNMNGNSGKSDVLDVKQGKLTLEQINLIFQHMPVDLSFVDENEIVKFYTDTKHRIFPRSAGVIGRDVKNCHPRESVSSVLEIIEAFRSGEQNEVDFWLEMNGKFIYIYYVAVRDENGKFKGVLEMMQDVTRIRGLEGKRTLVTWERPKKSDIKAEESKNSEKNDQKENPYGLTENTVIGEIIDKYPYIKEFMPTLSPTYKKLLDPIQYMIMSKVATLDMIAMRGGFPVEEIIEKISEKIKSEENKK